MKCHKDSARDTWKRRCISTNYREKSWLQQKYTIEMFSQGDIGRICGVDHMTIMRWMKKFSIPARPAGGSTMVGEKNYSWKGGRRGNGDGYIMVLCPGHPAANDKGYVYEHRLVVEKALGRHLKHNEIVHHVNGIKDDNRLSNLFLFEGFGNHLKFHRKKAAARKAKEER